ncbi:MAG: histidine triad nucleotide-binding protein [Candidatus Thermofonsia Clade 1 bacterium]|uniref:Histidine triad nucleotide-binding protein n=1 Tax=Candidatus Thermofonsia Clade 1 bacterium TaxID=2364210 RepID=A0A2M8PI12_9CHLR|nr:MAG: histidine triad nucleotide-binding protein [Candidatus Thermofonsia Clade 1 bacterium]
MQHSDCIFCQIIRGEAPATMLYQDERAVAFRDIAPIAPVHVLIVPRLHIASAAEVTAEHAPLIGHLIAIAAHIARQQGIAERGYRLVTNVGREGGQVIFHLHWHLIGGRQLRGIG